MGLIFVACMLLGAMPFAVNGQQTTCPTLPPFTMAATRPANQQDPNQYFVVGGMFDVNERGATAYECNRTVNDVGFLNMVAFFWGINKYFNSVLGNRQVSMGAVAFDNCMRYEQTIENMYDFAQCRINVDNMQRENLVAYVGPYTNTDAENAGALAADLSVTMFSPVADSPYLTFQNQETLLKMRPSFSYDLQGIVAFLNRVNASFVIILYSSSDRHWKAAYEELTQLIRSSSAATVPCIQYTADIDTMQMSTILTRLFNSVSVKYIVPLMSASKVSSLMTEMNMLSSTLSSFIFILTSRIGRDRQLLESKAALGNNTIIIDLTEPADFTATLNEFNSFLQMLNMSDSTPGLNSDVGKVWMTDYLTSKRPLDLTRDTTASPVKFSVYYTLSSVKAIIQGIDNAFMKCGGNTYQFCSKYRNLGSKVSALYLELKTKLGMHMNSSGDLLYNNIKYTIYVFNVKNDASSTITFQPLSNLTVTNGMVNPITEDLRNGAYGSLFGNPSCPNPGQGVCCEVITSTTAAPTTAVTGGNASTTSIPTTPSKYSQVMYPVGQVITGAFSEEERYDNEYGTRFDVGQKWIIALGVLAGLGILCVIVFEIYILYKLLGTPTGSRWRTMWLGQLLLFGIFLCYLVLFAYLPIPTKATCGITRFGVGVSYAFCFAVLLVKLMVILTSKPSDVLLPGDVETPNYLKGTYQFLMFIFAVGVQVVIDIQWLITVPPEAVKVTSNSGAKVWICNHYTWEAGSSMSVMSAFVRTEFENHLMSLIYIMIMILITTVLALKSHGIITNHRESIFIGIAAGFTIPIWLAWGLVGGLNKDHAYAHEFGDACIAFGLLITASLILFAMFLPKVRHLVNMGIEGIYLEDDRETIYGGSVILAPPSYKSKGSGSVIVLNNQGIYSEPVIINGDPMATHLKHPGSVYSVPANYMKHPESMYGGSTRVLRVTDDLRGRYPQKRSQSEVAYGASRRPRSHKGTLPRSRSQTNLGAL
ncbi:unnamed protein product [Candidula unifasciata]|uniref:G-protein coupled receptors family 3 profile domain-containing protein n=1 Tax=Candidula unifasciata TaxID=100452 RepID=A0A8S3ZG97_9EUPU|nr:unnamed protein product [Candidula unifasciata]